MPNDDEDCWEFSIPSKGGSDEYEEAKTFCPYFVYQGIYIGYQCNQKNLANYQDLHSPGCKIVEEEAGDNNENTYSFYDYFFTEDGSSVIPVYFLDSLCKKVDSFGYPSRMSDLFSSLLVGESTADCVVSSNLGGYKTVLSELKQEDWQLEDSNKYHIYKLKYATDDCSGEPQLEQIIGRGDGCGEITSECRAFDNGDGFLSGNLVCSPADANVLDEYDSSEAHLYDEYEYEYEFENENDSDAYSLEGFGLNDNFQVDSSSSSSSSVPLPPPPLYCVKNSEATCTLNDNHGAMKVSSALNGDSMMSVGAMLGTTCLFLYLVLLGLRRSSDTKRDRKLQKGLLASPPISDDEVGLELDSDSYPH